MEKANWLGVDPDPLSEGHIHGRLRGGASRLARQGRRRPFGLNHRAAGPIRGYTPVGSSLR